MRRVGSAVLAVLAVVAGSSSAVAAGRTSAPTATILKAGLMVARDVPSAWTSDPSTDRVDRRIRRAGVLRTR